MREEQALTGIVLYATLVGEYDKRLVILTKERGKITVFANGSRRPNSALRAASQSFVMGTFTVIPGRDAYNLVKVEVSDYFSDISYDIEKMCYASYFSEFMSYYTREGDFCTDNLNLLYCTLRAVVKGEMPLKLIKDIYEIRLMDIEGQGISAYNCVRCNSNRDIYFFDERMGGLLCAECAIANKVNKRVSPTLVYTLQFILSSPFNKLFSFKLHDDVMSELDYVTDRFRSQYVDREFKSLAILSGL